ncbi:hypothetical protein GJ700_31165 [Duganella sp. FT92W]|uniref:Uncharacterized protein n=1 Tax=Pseudoduganella rivuli TaxID=2666085 RepID=A0A7X2IVB8_9BURK|nr:hypothetical protein [Pseudoduganella rivuli]MRV76178.1 hypothetical protein [Pseudoduganella rivuli]
MDTANRTIRMGLLPAVILLCAASPASAGLNVTEAFAPVALESVLPAEQPKTNLSWLEQPVQGEQDASLAMPAVNLAAPASLVASHGAHIGRQREDMDLTANDSAILRYNLQNDEPIFSEHWWQALPGVGVALFLGLAMYMRHPIQRKRKYRSTPHEPYGGYSRRSP